MNPPACFTPDPAKARAAALVASLIADVAEGIRVLRDRDGVWISEDQIRERAVNIVTGLVGNYRILEDIQ
jgi:hypothetical protein